MIKLRMIEQIINEPNLNDEDKYKMIERIINDEPIFDVGEVVVMTNYSPGDDCDIAVVTYCSLLSISFNLSCTTVKTSAKPWCMTD